MVASGDRPSPTEAEAETIPLWNPAGEENGGEKQFTFLVRGLLKGAPSVTTVSSRGDDGRGYFGGGPAGPG